MSWVETEKVSEDPDVYITVEKMEITTDAPDERPSEADGWKYAGDNSVGSVYVRTISVS